jgi:hypothetical protein
VTRLAIIATFVVLAAWMTLAHRAKAHSWYDPECCSGMDCAAVDKVEVMPTSSIASMLAPPAQASPPSIMFVTTKHGTAQVPHNMQFRASKDGQMHACIIHGRLICLYMPPAM